MADYQNEPEWFKTYRERQEQEINQLKKDFEELKGKNGNEQQGGEKTDFQKQFADLSDDETNAKAAREFVESL